MMLDTSKPASDVIIYTELASVNIDSQVGLGIIGHTYCTNTVMVPLVMPSMKQM